ncbi:MAG TPA: hypothetical protein VGY55_23140 [Pirellulales bacterium]|nr:hypothetical protein [Pirellulales bacterium]
MPKSAKKLETAPVQVTGAVISWTSVDSPRVAPFDVSLPMARKGPG